MNDPYRMFKNIEAFLADVNQPDRTQSTLWGLAKHIIIPGMATTEAKFEYLKQQVEKRIRAMMH